MRFVARLYGGLAALLLLYFAAVNLWQLRVVHEIHVRLGHPVQAARYTLCAEPHCEFIVNAPLSARYVSLFDYDSGDGLGMRAYMVDLNKYEHRACTVWESLDRGGNGTIWSEKCH